MLDSNNSVDDAVFKRRFKLALYGFSIVEFVVTALVIIYKFKH